MVVGASMLQLPIAPLIFSPCHGAACTSRPLRLLLCAAAAAAAARPEQSTPHDLFPCSDPRPRRMGLDSLDICDVRLAFGDDLGVFSVQLLLRLRARRRRDRGLQGRHRRGARQSLFRFGRGWSSQATSVYNRIQCGEHRSVVKSACVKLASVFQRRWRSTCTCRTYKLPQV